MTIANRNYVLASLLLVAPLLAVPHAAWGARIKDLCEIQGARENILRGIGLVVGLAGTGDSAGAARKAQEEVLNRLTFEIDSINDIVSDNVAVVIVTATMPAFAKEGTRIDTQINSYFDAESLEGGMLMETQLAGIDGRVYAIAQGPVSVGGFNADAGGGNSVRNNHVTAGRIPMGATIEREIPSTITDGERIMLLLKRPDFGTAINIVKAVEKAIPSGKATALGAGTVGIVIPPDLRDNLVGFIATLQALEVESELVAARVVINERTGTIVIGGNVTIRPCQVAHGGLTITISTDEFASQPPPFSIGDTEVLEETTVATEEAEARLMPIGGASAAEVALALNKLRVTPRDLISIFQALREAGHMDADLESM